MTNLRFTALGAALSFNERRTLDEIMKDLGVTYTKSMSVGSQTWLWGCNGVPDNLPGYMALLDVDPMNCIGVGLTEDEAKSIKGEA